MDLQPDDLRFRDHMIVQLSAEMDMKAGQTPTPAVAFLARQSIPRATPLAYDVDAPIIFLEGDRMAHSLAPLYVDPPDSAPPIPVQYYLPKWAGFASLLSSSHLVEGQKPRDYAKALLYRAVHDSLLNRGLSITREFVSRLHGNRWTAGSVMAGDLLLWCTAEGAGGPENVRSDQEFLNSRIRSVRESVDLAKTRSRDLTEWGEQLYQIGPFVWEMMVLLKDAKIPDAEKWHRYFAEIDADISPVHVMNSCTATAILTGADDLPTWKSKFLAERKEAANRSEFMQRMQYDLYGRTSIPRYWYDLVSKLYDVPEEDLPRDVGEVDPLKVVSLAVLESWTYN